MDNRKIGVLDSGIGGLTVVRALFDALPNERLIYFGDSLNVPYGNRPKADVTRLSTRIIEFLKRKDVKAIVVACNTSSSICIDELRKAAGMPVIDVLTHSAVAVASVAAESVGIIATYNAVESGAHERIIRTENPALRVYARSCPLLVPIIEEGLCETEIAYAAARYYLSEFEDNKIDCLLLGCTHYPLLATALRSAIKVPIIDPAAYVAEAMKSCLIDMDALAVVSGQWSVVSGQGSGVSGQGSVVRGQGSVVRGQWSGVSGQHEFFTSGDPAVFDEHVRRVLGIEAKSVRVLY